MQLPKTMSLTHIYQVSSTTLPKFQTQLEDEVSQNTRFFKTNCKKKQSHLKSSTTTKQLLEINQNTHEFLEWVKPLEKTELSEGIYITVKNYQKFPLIIKAIQGKQNANKTKQKYDVENCLLICNKTDTTNYDLSK